MVDDVIQIVVNQLTEVTNEISSYLYYCVSLLLFSGVQYIS